jgi:hypothetical protein
MPVAQPYINSKDLLERTIDPKIALENRLRKKVEVFLRDIKSQEDVVRNYQKSVDTIKKNLEQFQLEIDNCMNEEDVKKLCQKAGV